MKRNLEGKEKDKESVNEAMGISDSWKEATINFIVDEISESDKVTDVINSLILDIKEEEFGKGDYETTAYEKKLMFAGILVEKALSNLVNKSRGVDSLLEMLKMLGEEGATDPSDDDEDQD
jgi:hypothetical protein